MERHKRIVAASLAAVLLLAACSDGDPEASPGGIEDIEEPRPDPDESDPERAEDEAAPAVEPGPDLEPGRAEIDITVVPDEITGEYLDEVFVELERLYAEALTEFILNDGELNVEVTDRLGEIFDGGDALGQNIQIFQSSADEGFPDIREVDDIEPRVRRVVELISSSPQCIYIETSADASPMVLDAGGDNVNFVQLIPKVGERPVAWNRSPWIYARVTTPFDLDDRTDIAENDPCDA